MELGFYHLKSTSFDMHNRAGTSRARLEGFVLGLIIMLLLMATFSVVNRLVQEAWRALMDSLASLGYPMPATEYALALTLLALLAYLGAVRLPKVAIEKK